MGRFVRSLGDLIPRTGRLLRENGEYVNQADRYLYQIGEEGNAWNDEQTGEDAFSAIVDTENLPHVSIMGVVDAATDLTFYVSQDGENFYFCAIISEDISPSVPPGQTEDFPATFHIFPTVGGRYIRIRSSNDVRATVTIAAKP